MHNYLGGAILSSQNCDVTIKGNSTVIIQNNTVDKNGGATYFEGNSSFTCKENAIVIFSNKLSLSLR